MGTMLGVLALFHALEQAVLHGEFPLAWLPGLLGISLGLLWILPWFLNDFPASGAMAVALGLAIYASWLASSQAALILVASFALCATIIVGTTLTTADRASRPTLLWLIALIALAAGVGNLSGSAGGAGVMTAWFRTWLHLPEAQLGDLVFGVRKSFHFSFYGVVALTSFLTSRSRKVELPLAFGFGILSTLCLATFDEGRQAFSPGRTSSPWDVFLDMTGAAVFSGVTYVILRARKRP